MCANTSKAPAQTTLEINSFRECREHRNRRTRSRRAFHSWPTNNNKRRHALVAEYVTLHRARRKCDSSQEGASKTVRSECRYGVTGPKESVQRVCAKTTMMRHTCVLLVPPTAERFHGGGFCPCGTNCNLPCWRLSRPRLKQKTPSNTAMGSYSG